MASSLTLGIAGAGKTIIASIVVDNLRHQRLHSQDHTSIGIAFVYLKYNDPEQSLNNILGSLLKQLIQDQGSLSTALSKLYESYGDLLDLHYLLSNTIIIYIPFHQIRLKTYSVQARDRASAISLVDFPGVAKQGVQPCGRTTRI